jgi:glycosyltransferase involved in cell wall biosynthesis
MKISILSDDFPPYTKGGAGIIAGSLARELAKRGHEVLVITSVQDSALVGSSQEEGMRIERLYSDYPQRWRSWRSLYNPSTVKHIRRLLAEMDPEVVHAHNVHYHLSYWALYLAKKKSAQVFLTAHDVMTFHYGKLAGFADLKGPMRKGNFDYRIRPQQQLRNYRFWYNPFRNFIIKTLLRNVDRIFAVSGALKEALNQNGISNVEVLHNGISIQEWSVDPGQISAFEKKHELQDKKIILFGGRISGLKGGGVMLEMLREVVKKEPEAVLALLGTRDSYVESLEGKAREWGIEKHLISLGKLTGDDWHAAFNAATVVCVPSLYLDPFPTVVLEAMACGKPVVGSCFGGIPEMIVDGETGYVVNPLHKKEFSEKVQELLTDEVKRLSFGVAARRHVAAFSVDGWVSRTVTAYQMDGKSN